MAKTTGKFEKPWVSGHQVSLPVTVPPVTSPRRNLRNAAPSAAPPRLGAWTSRCVSCAPWRISLGKWSLKEKNEALFSGLEYGWDSFETRIFWFIVEQFSIYDSFSGLIMVKFWINYDGKWSICLGENYGFTFHYSDKLILIMYHHFPQTTA